MHGALIHNLNYDLKDLPAAVMSKNQHQCDIRTSEGRIFAVGLRVTLPLAQDFAERSLWGRSQ